MNDKNIELNIKITDEMIEEYYSKMNILKQKNTIIWLIILLLIIIISFGTNEREYTMLITGLLIGYFLIIVTQQSKSKKISKKLFKIIPNEYKCIITEENIKMIYIDNEIRNKINYNDINMVYESDNLLIVLYNLNTRSLLINKNLLSQEQIDKLKKILSANLDCDKLKFKKQNVKNSKINKNIKKINSLGILLIVFIFVVTVFTYTEKTTYVPNYNKFINEQSYKFYGNKAIFPKEIPQSAERISYYFYYKYKIINLNPTYQVCLEYMLDENDFKNEIERLESFNYDTENFKYPAYISLTNNANIYEYVLVKEDERKLIYIYLQDVNKKELDINIEYIPHNMIN